MVASKIQLYHPETHPASLPPFLLGQVQHLLHRLILRTIPLVCSSLAYHAGLHPTLFTLYLLVLSITWRDERCAGRIGAVCAVRRLKLDFLLLILAHQVLREKVVHFRKQRRDQLVTAARGEERFVCQGDVEEHDQTCLAVLMRAKDAGDGIAVNLLLTGNALAVCSCGWYAGCCPGGRFAVLIVDVGSGII